MEASAGEWYFRSHTNRIAGDAMEKVSIGTNVFVYPMPIVLVGTLAKGKANFLTVGWVSRVNGKPPMIAVAINKLNYSGPFVVENGTFSVNVPSAALREKVDYCGLVSGETADKSQLFDVFYGDLKTAPLIRECPLCIECRLVQALELPSSCLFIGEIVASHADKECLSDGSPDLKKIDPFMISMPDGRYWTVGPQVGKAWSDGEQLINK
jgi:flavin reductase (DIM6/NTAB) family NADH-FMN oxidoreductase RutF